MPNRLPLPPTLTLAPFRTAEAIALGVPADRLREDDLDAPFHGVRSVGLDLAVLENRCVAYAARMRAGELFSHATAARLWGIPLPLGVDSGPLHVTVNAPLHAARAVGVIGHRRMSVVTPALVRGLAVTSPADTWADLAELLEVHDLIAAGDVAITGNPFRDRRPLCDPEMLRVIAARRRGSGGSRNRARALGSLQVGPVSRPESLVRQLLAQAGIPRPQINTEILGPRGDRVATPDFAWHEWKVALEYEGDDHRSVRRFRDDIARIERLVDLDWLIVKASADDLYDRPRELVERVIRRLASRGWVSGRIDLPRNGIYAR